MRGCQRYRCKNCKHRWLQPKRESLGWIVRAYEDYTNHRYTLAMLSRKYGKSIPTIRKYFDAHEKNNGCRESYDKEINLVLDTTFFGQTEGWMVCRAAGRTIDYQEVTSENLASVQEQLLRLSRQGYIFKSVTVDGRRGVIRLIERLYPGVPVQFCVFHQKQIVRRYITNNPKSLCGLELKHLMSRMLRLSEDEFAGELKSLEHKHSKFLKEKNEQGKFMHTRMRSAFRSLRTNLPWVFAYKNYPELNIPNTTNSCDGFFAGLKGKIKLHSGLKGHRRKQMIRFLLDKS